MKLRLYIDLELTGVDGQEDDVANELAELMDDVGNACLPVASKHQRVVRCDKVVAFQLNGGGVAYRYDKKPA